MSPRKPLLAPQVTTLWEYPSQHYGDTEQGSSTYRGATPSWVIWNVLQRFTEPGAVVVDPFCGSGTTLDVCRDLDRRGHGFDLAPFRPDIGLADARSLPLRAGTADLVFMDPPYADNLEYSDDARCIGKLPANGRYQRAMRLVIAEAARVLKDDGVLAIYVCDIFKKDRGFYPLGFELFDMARELFLPLDIISVVRHNRTLQQGNYRKAADEQGFYLRGFNWLLLLKKRRKPLRAATPGLDDSEPIATENNRPPRARPAQNSPSEGPAKVRPAFSAPKPTTKLASKPAPKPASKPASTPRVERGTSKPPRTSKGPGPRR